REVGLCVCERGSRGDDEGEAESEYEGDKRRRDLLEHGDVLAGRTRTYGGARARTSLSGASGQPDDRRARKACAGGRAASSGMRPRRGVSDVGVKIGRAHV